MFGSTSNPVASLFLKEICQSNGIIDIRKLKQIPGGGTHDIYRIESEESPSFLLKVMKHTIGKDEFVLKEQLKKLTDQYAILYDVFEPHRCIVEDRSIQELITTGASASQKGIISIVPFDTCFQSEKKFGFNAEPLEINEVIINENPELYRTMNLALMGADKYSKTFNPHDYLIFHQACQPVFSLLEDDDNLQNTMREFLIKFQRFYNQTGMFLDFIGRDNVVFYKSNEGWQFKLGSVIKHDTRSLLLNTLAEIAHKPSAVKDSFEKITSIFFMPSCIRLLNVLAELLKIDRIVADVIISQEASDQLAKSHEQLKYSTRAVTYAEHNDFENALKFFRLHEDSDEEHDTYVRYILGTRYWQFIKDTVEERPREEIMLFLAILHDEKNQFLFERQDLANAAIEGLQSRLNSPERTPNSEFAVLSKKFGFFRVMIEKRHENPALQHEYDKRFGLVVKN